MDQEHQNVTPTPPINPQPDNIATLPPHSAEENPASEISAEEEARRKAIFESASHRHAVKKMVHTLTGHPKDQVVSGNVHEGATCACGAHWTIADFQV